MSNNSTDRNWLIKKIDKSTEYNVTGKKDRFKMVKFKLWVNTHNRNFKL